MQLTTIDFFANKHKSTGAYYLQPLSCLMRGTSVDSGVNLFRVNYKEIFFSFYSFTFSFWYLGVRVGSWQGRKVGSKKWDKDLGCIVEFVLLHKRKENEKLKCVSSFLKPGCSFQSLLSAFLILKNKRI